jgi:hypothetical protein
MDDDRRPAGDEPATDPPAAPDALPPELEAPGSTESPASAEPPAPAESPAPAEPPAPAWPPATTPAPPAPPSAWPPAAPPADPYTQPPPVAPLVDWSAPPAEPGSWQYAKPPGWGGLDVMSVFGRAVDTFIGHWMTFVALSLPAVLVSLLSFGLYGSRADASFVLTELLALLVFAAIGVFVPVSIAMATDDVHAGRRVSALAVLGPAVGRAAVALVSAIVVWLATIGLLIVPAFLFSAGVVAGGAGGAVFGLVALLAGGAVIFYVLFRWAFSPIAIAIDRAGPLGGLSRSWTLTRGNLWRLGVLIIGIGVLTAPWTIAGSLLSISGNTVAGAVVGIVGALLFGSLGSIVLTIAYGDVTGRWLAAAAPVAPATPEWWVGTGPAEQPPSEPAVSEPAIPVEPAAVEPVPPVAWGPEATDQPPAWSASPATPPAPAAAAASAPSFGVTRSERRAYVLGVFLVGLLLLVPAIGLAGPSFANLGFAGVPQEDRGKILAGTQRDALNPCAPKDQATEFQTTDTIYIGGYFNRAVMPGQSATVHVFIDGTEAAKAPLTATTQMVGCYYEQDPLTGLGPAEYRVLVDDPNGVLAEGSFTVR